MTNVALTAFHFGYILFEKLRVRYAIWLERR